jgi:hypothetical protein
MLQTLKLNKEKKKKSLFYEGKTLVGLTPVLTFVAKDTGSKFVEFSKM